jgi:hypothetical protein
MLRFGCIILSLLFFVAGRAQPVYKTSDYIRALKQATDVMVNDVTSPVAASRYYAYICLAANETQSFFKGKFFSYAAVLNEWKEINVSADDLAKAESSFTVLYSLYRMSARLLPSGPGMQGLMDSLVKDARVKGLSEQQVLAGKKIGDSVVHQLLLYVNADRFRELSRLTKYTPQSDPAYWQPTAPGYMQALEPHWGRLRPFLLEKADQFRPQPPAAYDTSASSSFMKQLREVYATGNRLNKQKQAIANFWDCNPFALQQIGHIEFGLKKISPGGHWMGIAGIACHKAGKSFEQTVAIHAILAISLADAFISCWEEKYRSNRVRPETAIRRLLDPQWKPLLQTPPFPEYTSGHSVASNAAAVVLTKIFGENFAFSDNTETEFGLPVRTFKSFSRAAAEASVSRLYGGIHYRDAVENGVIQGRQIGNFAIERFGKQLGALQAKR